MHRILFLVFCLLLVFVGCQHSEVWRYVEYKFANWTPDGKIICVEEDNEFKVLKYDLIGGEDVWFLEIEYKLLEIDKEGGNCRQIAVVARATGEEGYEEMNTGELWYLHNKVGHPNLSCSGDKIVFSIWGKDYEKYEMWIINRDGSSLKKLSDKGTYPDLSPDGKRVVYEKPGEGIWIINSDGTGDHQITTNPKDSWPAWSPLGDKIAFARTVETTIIDSTTGRNIRLLIIALTDTSSGNCHEIWCDSTILIVEIGGLDFSWDGKKLYFGSYAPFILDIESQMAISLPEGVGGKWSPDGTMFVGGGVYTMNVDGTNRKRILTGRAWIESKWLW